MIVKLLIYKSYAMYFKYREHGRMIKNAIGPVNYGR